MNYIIEKSIIRKRKTKRRKHAIIVVAVILAILITGTLAAIPPLIMSEMVNSHVDVKLYSPDDYGIQAGFLKLKTEDGLSIAAWEVKHDNPKGIVILLSGIQNPSVTAFWGYSKMLRDNDYASLLIEMRGHGDSEGDRVALGIEEILDVKAGVAYIMDADNYRDVPIIVWGTSMGGATAINSIGEIPEIDGIISCSAYSSWQDAFCDNMANMGMPPFIAAMEKPFVSLYMGFVYGFDKLDINPLAEIQKLNGRPALLMHSRGDSQVPYLNFERLRTKGGSSVETFEREGDEHFICYDGYFENPIEDKAFSSAVLNFLKDNFN